MTYLTNYITQYVQFVEGVSDIKLVTDTNGTEPLLGHLGEGDTETTSYHCTANTVGCHDSDK